MADSVTYSMDTSTVIAALDALGEAAQAYINDASKETADAIVREADARLARQLGPARAPTAKRPDLGQGLTRSGLTARPAYDGNGYVVVDEREPFPNLPIWLEKGTKRGDGTHANTARPFFYVSALLEEGNHFRRITEAVQHAINDGGLGD